MADYPVGNQSNGNIQIPKTFTPYVPPPIKTYQPFTPSSVSILSSPMQTKEESRGDGIRTPGNLSPLPGPNAASSSFGVGSFKQ